MSYHMSIADTVDRFRRPEYTGANRCTPCTVVNVCIAVVVAGTVTMLVPWFGIGLFVLFFGTIYLRGYLVPGTPSLTKRYLPPRVLRLFGKNPIDFDDATSADSAGVERENDGTLVAAGVVTRTESDIALTSEFRDEWRECIHTTRERTLGTADVREMLDAETISTHGDRSFVVDGNTSVRWGSDAAFIADIAAASILTERLDEWTAFDWDRQRSVLLGLRLCLERCPSCDGPVEMTEDRVDPCCQKPHLVAQSICENCGAALADAAVVEGGKEDSVRLRLLES
jgi:hypothetical protein